MNPGGIRADIRAGNVTWGDLFTVQPFGNSLVKMTLTGQQIYDLLNQQWQPTVTHFLQISGLTYTWNNNAAVRNWIVDVRQKGTSINKAAVYTVTVNNFPAAGGDSFTILTQDGGPIDGPIDLDALISYVQTLAQPFSAAIEGRITRLN